MKQPPIMKIETDYFDREQYKIDAYADTAITVNGISHTSSLIITPGRLIPGWDPRELADIATQHIDELIRLRPEIIILGTGRQTRFPAPEIIAGIFEHQIGFEVMDTGAACRCYNLLLGENRKVAAGLIIPAE